ncbi:ATP-binding protein [Aureivirga marina]|uniref:ATP-binding protein n=1 Tax=Aureivirga marina TaxID=1182451 RepID=UPI0018CA8154|nr:sensor histidine kinase [Aureivirga marina]
MNIKINKLIGYLVFISILFFTYFTFSRCSFVTSKKETITDTNLIKKELLDFGKKKDSSLHFKNTYLNDFYIKYKSELSDSSNIGYLIKLSTYYNEIGNDKRFYKLNKQALEIADEFKDTLSLARINWNFAHFYKKREVYDSAYYHYYNALKGYESKNEKHEIALMKYGMSVIRGFFGDYLGAEKLTISSLNIFKELNAQNNVQSMYNHLGLLQKDLDELDKAERYHIKALEIIKELEKDNKDNLYIRTYNNLGRVYQEKREFEKSLYYFDEALKLVDKKDEIKYARLIDNYAYTKVLQGNTNNNVLNNLNKALEIRKSIDNKSGELISKLHIAEYFLKKNNQDRALETAREALEISEKLANTENYLKALHLLSEIDIDKRGEHLEDYIKVSDSVTKRERRIQNKFARIEFETDEYIEKTRILTQKTEQLSEQKIWLVSFLFFLIVLIILIYFLIVQKQRNEKLLLENEKQQMNEQIYSLKLNQHMKIQNEKNNERNRISEELHDSVLSKLFGVRLHLSFFKMSDIDKDTKSTFENHLTELQEIEKEIRGITHQLNKSSEDINVNFVSLIKELILSKESITDCKFSLHSENDDWENVAIEIRVNLYRIIQEAIQNILKHAKAKNVDISIKRHANQFIEIIIKDDGVGFDLKKKKNGIGVKNIKARVLKLKGEVEFKSELGKGVEIKITIPT